MINTQQIQKIFNTDQIEFSEEYKIIRIEKKNIVIFIHPYIFTSDMTGSGCWKQRKNCCIVKPIQPIKPSKTHIYLHIDYIKYIIRQQLLNILLND